MPTKDPIKLRLKRQRYYQKNKEVLSLKSKQWKLKNPDYAKEYRLNNKDKIIERERKYKKENRDIINKSKRNYNFRKTRSLLTKPNYMFKSIVTRIKTQPSYKNKKIMFTKPDFVKWVLANENYHRLFKIWEESGYSLMSCPSVDRIDNKGHYSFDNIQIISNLENSKKRDL